MAAPPLLRQHELAAFGRADGMAGRLATAPGLQQRPVAQDIDEKLSETWRHVKTIAGSEAKNYDLMDLLSGTGREDTYQTPLKGFPSLLRPVSVTMPELPGMVQDKYRTCQTMCFCGVFPEIRRAWASVDNSLFMWRYDRRGDVPVEYGGEEQAICCVGLARPKPGVFLAAIQHILVLATTAEIVLLGVCISPAPGGDDAFEQVSLQPMPMYSVPSDDVIMTSFASTPSGRLFMGGADGHVYEIQYAASDSWRQRRCSKVRITSGLQQMLPSLLRSWVRKPEPLEKLVHDDERNILYSLASNNVLQVFDLGPDGQEPARRVAELTDYVAEASNLPGRYAFQQKRKGDRTADDERNDAIKHLAVIPMAESWKIHLMAVTTNGRRVYFTTNPNVRGGGSSRDGRSVPRHLDPKQTRPSVLMVVDTRAALPQKVPDARMASPDVISRVMDVTAALYSQGTLLLAESQSDGKATKLLAAVRNYTLPPPSVNVNIASNSAGLREMVSEFDGFIPGETTAIGCLPQASLLGPDVHPGGSWGAMQDELVSQMFSGPPQLVLVSTAGVLQLERRRPVDVLQELLQEGSPEKLQGFFKAYGPPEAAAMCYLLATTQPAAKGLDVLAGAALENPLLVGQPLMPEEGLGTEATQNAGATGGGIYMGAAVNPNPEPEWSGAHKGLALYISRLLAPVWDVKLITPSRSNPDVWKARLTDATMSVLEHKLRALDTFLTAAAERRRLRGFRAENVAAAAGLGGGLGGSGLFMGYLEDGASRLNAAAGAAGAGGGGGLVPGDAPYVKRQRLWNAAVMEEQRNNAIRLMASKAAQALFLLQTLAAANVNRLANRLDADSRRALKDLNFRDLVLEGSGPALATQLVAAYMSDLVQQGSGAAGASGAAAGISGAAAGSVAELAASLQSHAPSYFRDQDRQFFQATAKLKAAEEAGSVAERDALAQEALGGLLRVPQCVNLSQMIPRLAFLRQYKGIVELVVRCAALADPHSLAWQHGSTADTAAARTARDRCYAHLLAVLKPLLGIGPVPVAAPVGAAAAAAGPGGRVEGAPLAPTEQQEARSTMIQAILNSNDRYLVTVLYSTLVDVGADPVLLSYDSVGLEVYLREEGGLGGQTALGLGLSDPSIGPLGRRQVRHLQLLASLYIKKKKYDNAARVYCALAKRSSGHGDSAVSLDERLKAFQDAFLQAGSVGNAELKEMLHGCVEVMSLQCAIDAALSARLEQLGAAAARPPSSRAAAAAAGPQPPLPAGISQEQLVAQLRELRSSCLDISDLYNTYAQPYEMWDMCLQIINFAGSVVPEYVQTLWDLLLKQAWETASSADGEVDCDVRLSHCCDKVQALGAKFYPNEGSLPLLHVILRLESISAGLWPNPCDAATDNTRVVQCLKAMLAPEAKENASGIVAGLYEQLLSRRGTLLEGGVAGAGVVLGGSGDTAAENTLRLSVLRSLAALCRIVLRDELSSTLPRQPDLGFPSHLLGRAHQADALAELAERNAERARSLASAGPVAAAGQQVAEEFDRVVAELRRQR